MFSIELENLDAVMNALDQWADDVIKELIKAQDENGEHLLAAAMALAPKLTGDLEGSGTKTDAKADAAGKMISVEIGFNKVYAARRHEEPSKPGPITRGKPAVDGMAPGPKYIERPLKFYINQYMQNLADAVKRVTGF